MARPTGAVLRNSRIHPSSVHSCIASSHRELRNCWMERIVVISSASWVDRWHWLALVSPAVDAGPKRRSFLIRVAPKAPCPVRWNITPRRSKSAVWPPAFWWPATTDDRSRSKATRRIRPAMVVRPHSRRRPFSISTTPIAAGASSIASSSLKNLAPPTGRHSTPGRTSTSPIWLRPMVKASPSSPSRPTRQASNACSVHCGSVFQRRPGPATNHWTTWKPQPD